MYGILDTGFGGTLIAGPWSTFQLKEDVKNKKSCLITLNKTSDELKNAPTIDKAHMPDFTDAKWKKTVEDFFGVRTVVQPPATKR
jgi:hypothetical protein